MRADLLGDINAARQHKRDETRKATAELLRRQDRTLLLFAPKQRTKVLRESASVYRSQLWFRELNPHAIALGRKAGLPEYKFAGWVHGRMSEPPRGSSVLNVPEIPESWVDEYRRLHAGKEIA